MKTTMIKGLTVLGIGAVIIGIGAATPAKADDWHDRRRVEIVRTGRVVLGVGPIEVVTPCPAPVIVVDRYANHDWRWRRDHCR